MYRLGAIERVEFKCIVWDDFVHLFYLCLMLVLMSQGKTGFSQRSINLGGKDLS